MRYVYLYHYFTKKPNAMSTAASINPAFATGFVVARNIEMPGEPIIGTNKSGKYKGLSAESFAKAMRAGGTCWSFRLEAIA